MPPSYVIPWCLPNRNESTYPHKDLCMNVPGNFAVIAKNWKRLKCSSAGEWIKKERYIHAMEYYLAKRKGENYWSMQQHG